MKLEAIGRIREEIIKEKGWSEVQLISVQDTNKKDSKGVRILFSGTLGDPPQMSFVGEADGDGKLLEVHAHNIHPTRPEKVKQILENSGYKFEHPTLVLEGKDGWFVILTPHRSPHQAIVHWDGRQADFFATIPEQLMIEE